MEAGSAALRVDWPVYPRRAEHNTVAEGGIEDGPRLRVRNAASALNTADSRALRRRGVWKNAPRRRPGGFAERLGVRGVREGGGRVKASTCAAPAAGAGVMIALPENAPGPLVLLWASPGGPRVSPEPQGSPLAGFSPLAGRCREKGVCGPFLLVVRLSEARSRSGLSSRSICSGTSLAGERRPRDTARHCMASGHPPFG